MHKNKTFSYDRPKKKINRKILNGNNFQLYKQVCLYSPLSNLTAFLAAVTITYDSVANFDLCIALTAFSSDGSFTCHTFCDMGPRFTSIRSQPKNHSPRHTCCGIPTLYVKINRSLCRRSNHCTTRAT
jgi:hypothetical protein